MRGSRGALKHFSLNNSQVTSFDSKDTRMINHNFINALYTRKLHFKLSWIHSSCPERTRPLVERGLLHKVSSNKLGGILILHHLHFASPTRHYVGVLLLKRWSHLRIHHKTLLWLTTSHLRKRRGHQHYILATTPCFLCCLWVNRC
jgi:hypothetical protein